MLHDSVKVPIYDIIYPHPFFWKCLRIYTFHNLIRFPSASFLSVFVGDPKHCHYDEANELSVDMKKRFPCLDWRKCNNLLQRHDKLKQRRSRRSHSDEGHPRKQYRRGKPARALWEINELDMEYDYKDRKVYGRGGSIKATTRQTDSRKIYLFT